MPAAVQVPSKRFDELLGEAQRGSELAKGRLLLMFYDRVLDRVQRRLPAGLRGLGWAEDIVQDALSSAAASLGSFRPIQGVDCEDAFFRWLSRIAEHRMLDAIRHETCDKAGGGRVKLSMNMDADGSSVGPLLSLIAPGSTPSRAARCQEFEAAVRAAMDRLYPPYREILELRLVFGLNTQQMRVRLRKESDTAVRRALSRALESLREEIGDVSRYISRG